MALDRNLFRSVSIIFFGLMALSGFGRFDDEFLPDSIIYPFPLELIIEYNRAIIGSLLVFFSFRAVIFGGLRILVPIGPLGVVIVFHCFLSFKMFFGENPGWHINIIGGIVLYLIYRVVFEFCGSERLTFWLQRLVVYSVAFWIGAATFMYIVGGEDLIAWNGRYFFFSSHMNHSGAVWSFSSVFLFSFLLAGKSRIDWLKVLLLVVSISFLVMTGSRGSLIGFLCGAFAVLKFSEIRASVAYPIIFILAFLLIATNYDILFSFFDEQVQRGNTREVGYAIALEDFLNNMLFGISIVSGRALYVENTILAFMQLGGIIGLSCAIVFYTGCISLLMDNLRGKRPSEIELGLLAVFVCAIASSMFEAFPLNFISTGSFMLLLPLAYFNRKKYLM